MAVQESDAVRADQGGTVLLAGVEDALLESGSGLGLLAKACRDDDEGAHTLLAAEVIDIVGAELCGHHEDGQLGLGDVLHVVEGLDALHLVFLGIHYIQGACEAAVLDITHNGTTGLVHVVGATDNDDAPWI